MEPGKCALLKPVTNLTGTFFTFSQYTQDLTKQYTNCDAYRCVPSKFIAMNLNFSPIIAKYTDEISSEGLGRFLGEIFQNYFENSCAFLRAKYDGENNNPTFNPEDTRTLLFQTLQKYRMMNVRNNTSENIPSIETLLRSQSVITPIDPDEDDSSDSAMSYYSDQIQYIGDINIYSYNDNADGVGYNEIYCYIPNEAMCMDYAINKISSEYVKNPFNYTDSKIVGWNNENLDANIISYNGLGWDVSGTTNYFDGIGTINNRFYGVGKYTDDSNEEQFVYIPDCLINEISDDTPRIVDDVEGGNSFNFNTIVVLYDIVQKGDNEEQITLYKNIPLGIYFTGAFEEYTSNDTTNYKMSNEVTKYVTHELVYNQGTSYGLRICTRFLCNPLSTITIETSTVGSSNVSEIAPVLEKMAETIASAKEIVTQKGEMYQFIKNHLSQFKNNKVNVPYIRQLGDKKYWFVNGKNTGAVADIDLGAIEKLKEDIESVLEDLYTKEDIDEILEDYMPKSEIDTSNFVTKQEFQDAIKDLENKLKVWLQGEEDEE